MSENRNSHEQREPEEVHLFDDPMGNKVMLVDDGKMLTATTMHQDSPLAYVNGSHPDGQDDYVVMSVGLPQNETIIDKESGKVVSDYRFLGKEILARDREGNLMVISERNKGVIKAKTHTEFHHADYPPTRLTTRTKLDKQTGEVLDEYTSMDI